jgi:hypothetical protein
MDRLERIDDILSLEISEEVAEQLSEALVSWKEEYASNLEEKNNEILEEKLQEIDEMNERWREEMAEEYSEKFISMLSEMRDEVKANVLAEFVDTDPTYKLMEEIKRLVAPTIDEEYTKNIYLEELLELRSQVSRLEEEKELEEGKRTLEELIENYDDKIKPLLREFIGAGSPDEVEDKFYKLITTLNEDTDDDDDDDFDIDDDDFDFDDLDFDDLDEDLDDLDEFSSILEEFEEDGDASGITPRKKAILDLVK